MRNRTQGWIRCDMRGAKDDSQEIGLSNWIKVIDIYQAVEDWSGAGWGKKSKRLT